MIRMCKLNKLRRHDLLYLSDSWKKDLQDPIRQYYELCLGVPLIKAAQTENTQKGYVTAGLSLPVWMNGSRKRFLLDIPECEIEDVKTPWQIAGELCGRESKVAKMLRFLQEQTHVQVGVYGSFALEAVSGYSYVTEHSDLDMIVRCVDKAELRTVRHLLPELEYMIQMPIDMEVRITDCYDVKISELCGISDSVLCKTVAGPKLMNRKVLWNML